MFPTWTTARHTVTTRFAAGCAAVLALAAVTGCGGSKAATDTAGTSGTTAAATTAKTPPATTTAAAAPAAPPAQNAQHLKIGQPGLVVFRNFENDRKSMVEVTPTTVTKAPLSDFTKAGVKLEPSQTRSTPYYVHLRLKNVGTGDLSGAYPTSGVTTVDDEGEMQTSITILGEFPPCGTGPAPKPFKHGDSYEACLAFFVPPGGGTVKGVVWGATSDTPKDVTWTR